MSNILIIKHGSLGDLIQANGAIKDIRHSYPDYKIFILTTHKYADLMSVCPFIDGVLIDKRRSRMNIFYLFKLKKMLDRFSFVKIFDLQNSSRTKFYQKFLFKGISFSSTNTTLRLNEKKSELNKIPVLDRMQMQLERSGVKIQFTKKPDIGWARKNVKNILNQYFEGNFIILFPFCSPKLTKKKWPYFKDLIEILKKNYGNKYNFVVAPDQSEIEDSEKLGVNIVLEKDKALSIINLIGLIDKASYVIANDTGPAHIAAHLNKKGIVLFGSHTSADKVSIETENFKSIQVNNLRELSVSTVFERIRENLDKL